MIDRFQEMIKSGVAERKHQTFLPNIPETDPVVRTYNNCFGLFTDTHMSKTGECEYVITGSLCREPSKFDSFLYSVNYGLGTHFKVDGKVMSLSCFLSSRGLRGQYGYLNGDAVYKISQLPPVNIDKGCGYGVCCMGNTADAPYPVQLGEKLVETLTNFLEASETIADFEKSLNESECINGSDWTAFETSCGFGVCSDSVGKALLFSKCK